MRRCFRAVGAILGLCLMPTPAAAKCTIAKYFELPVTMRGRQPTVTIQFNGRDARMLLDSGAFFSTIARANALEYGLKINPLEGRLQGIGGTTSLGYTTVKQLVIAGQTVPNVEFAVGGSDTGLAGILGQNILGLADVEYDLPHGVVRIMKSSGCQGGNMAYWAGAKPSTMLAIQPMNAGQRHTIGTVLINGKKVDAVFDTGAQSSLLTQSAAKRLGMVPDGTGVTAVGYSYGLGQGRVRMYRAQFATIDIGGELIRKPWLNFAETGFGGEDMLIGIDFFLTHRIYVDNQTHRMFVTYEGGPMFGLDPKGAVDNAGTALDLTDTAAAPTDAAGFSQRAAIQMSHSKYADALADLDRALAMTPGNADYLYQRAVAHRNNRQPFLAAQDLDQAITANPAQAEARLARAQLRLGGNDPQGATADLKAADAALAPSSDARLRLAGLYDNVQQPEAALASYDAWLKAHPEDSGRAVALNGRCWARGQLNRELDRALSDCDDALKLRPGTAAYLDSRALIRLRRNELDRALADYDAAIAVAPRNAWSLYGRSLAARRAGKLAQADTDKAAALAINPRVAERAKRLGLEP